ncbi:MAG: hypothetical protein AAFO82_23395, partial [Bacteroidota bacterium]
SKKDRTNITRIVIDNSNQELRFLVMKIIGITSFRLRKLPERSEMINVHFSFFTKAKCIDK